MKTVINFTRFMMILFIMLTSGCTSPTAIPTIMPTVAPAVTSTPTAVPTPTVSAVSLAPGIDAYLTKLAEQDRFSGSVLVATDGEILLEKGYGLANVEPKIPNIPQTKFRIGSVTKQFIAMAILQLQEQGKLYMQDLICRYIPDCPSKWRVITIHHLLTHTSGIPEFGNAPGILEEAKNPITPAQTIDHFRNLPLDFEPGERWSYSNSGYVLLGSIIEKVTGQPYSAYLQESILAPLHMENTGVENDQTSLTDHAVGYYDKNTVSDFVDVSWLYARGDLYSTVGDLYVWDQALYTERLLSTSMREMMFKSYAPIQPPDLGYGYGWIVGKRFNRLWIHHTGEVPGFVSEIDRCPGEKVLIVVLSNREDTHVEDIVSQVSMKVFAP